METQPSLSSSLLLLVLVAAFTLLQLSTAVHSSFHVVDSSATTQDTSSSLLKTSTRNSIDDSSIVVEKAKDAFLSLITSNSSMDMTVNITVYLGGRGINGQSDESTSCGLSIQNPCKSFPQVFYSMNETLFRNYSEFLNMKSVTRNVVLKVIVIGEEPFICGGEWYLMEYFELLRFFLEITHLDGHSNVVTCIQTINLLEKGLLIPQGFEALYIHDSVLQDMIIIDVFISIMIENCFFNNSRVLDNNVATKVEEDMKSKYFILENSIFTEILVVNYRSNVVISRSTLESPTVFYLCGMVLLSDSFARTLIDIQETSVVHVERTLFAMIHTFTCDHIRYINCETTDVNEKTRKLMANISIINILTQSGISITVKDMRSHSGKLFSSVNSFQTAIFENITLSDTGIPTQDISQYFFLFKDVVSTTLRNLQLDTRFSFIQVDSYSILYVINCHFSQKRQLVVSTVMANGYRSQVLLSKSKFSNSIDSAVSIQNAFRLYIDACEFENNVAIYSGGAVRVQLLAANLFVRGSKFINNRVSCNGFPKSSEVAYCAGGAISIENAVHDSNFKYPFEFSGKNEFIGNQAMRGGALYLAPGTYLLTFQYTIFVNNTATLSGGAIFFYHITLPILSGCEFSGNRAVMGMDYTIPLILSSANFSGNLPTLVNGNYQLLIGEQYNISFTVKSRETGMIVPFSDQILYFYSSSSFIKLTQNQYSNYISFKANVFGNETSQFLKVPTKIIIGNGINTIEIPIQIGDCKSGTELDKSLTQDSSIFNYECKKIPQFPVETYVAIIVGSSLFLFILGILFGLGMYCMVTIIKKLNRLKRKERAEQAIENKLIDKRMVFEWTEAEEQYYAKSTTNDTQNASSGSSTKYRSLSNDTELSQSLVRNSKSSRYPNDDASFIIPIEEISIEKRIGEGGSANVFLGSWSNIKVAIKSLKFDSSGNFDDNEEFEKEAAVLSRLRHPNVLIFYGVCMTEKSKYIVTEYMENGSLERFISNSKHSNFTNQHLQNVLRILLYISNGMVYLHSLKPAIIHRDLKPGNILLNDKNQAKVSDFGLVKLVSNTVHTNMTKQIGTILYISPETFISETQIENKEASKIDVYSFAIIMWEMFFRITPFQHVKNTFQVPPLVMNGQRPEIPFDISNADEIKQWITSNTQLFNNDTTIECVQIFMKLIIECWKQNPADRPTFNKIYESLEEIVDRL